MLKIVTDGSDRESVSVLDELVVEGARRMLAAALERLRSPITSTGTSLRPTRRVIGWWYGTAKRRNGRW